PTAAGSRAVQSPSPVRPAKLSPPPLLPTAPPLPRAPTDRRPPNFPPPFPQTPPPSQTSFRRPASLPIILPHSYRTSHFFSLPEQKRVDLIPSIIFITATSAPKPGL